MTIPRPRIGLILMTEWLPAWQVTMLEHLQRSVDIQAIIFYHNTSEPNKNSVALYKAKGIQRLESWVNRQSFNATTLRNVLTVLDESTPVAFFWTRQATTLNQVKVLHLDLLLDLSEQPLAGTWYQAATLGVWRYFYNANGVLQSSQTGLAEYYAQHRLVFSGLKAWTAAYKNPHTLFIGSTSTHPSSLLATVNQVLWRMVEYVPQVIETLKSFYPYQIEHLYLLGQRFAPALQRMEQIYLNDWEDNQQMSVMRHYGKRALHHWHQTRTLSEQWSLLIGETTNPFDLNHLGRFTKLLPPPERAWSDPCLVEHQGRHYVFMHEWHEPTQQGRIVCMQLTEQGGYSLPIVVLERPYSVSYPFIFNYQGEYYLIPETLENQQVELYRCTEFPQKWVLDRVLMTNVHAVDTTLFEYMGRWWMMQGRSATRQGTPNSSLYLYYADSPLSKYWIPHPHNPIVTEVDRARPAGRPFRWRGRWYRPSQNCAGANGRGLNINEITALDTSHYQEHCVVRCVPQGRHQLGGIQTISFNPKLTVLDGLHLNAKSTVTL